MNNIANISDINITSGDIKYPTRFPLSDVNNEKIDFSFNLTIGK